VLLANKCLRNHAKEAVVHRALNPLVQQLLGLEATEAITPAAVVAQGYILPDQVALEDQESLF
jgi:hypothetical protein